MSHGDLGYPVNHPHLYLLCELLILTEQPFRACQLPIIRELLRLPLFYALLEGLQVPVIEGRVLEQLITVKCAELVGLRLHLG
jgi:hypothetical protein